MSSNNDKRKTFVVDTSVLLYDKCAIHSFTGNDVVIPLIVLDELDRNKDKPGLVGENARYVNRFLDDLRKENKLFETINLKNDQTIRVEIESHQVPQGLDPSFGDNKIIATAYYLTKSMLNTKVVMVTKDINFRIKCDALGIEADDYYKDRVIQNKDAIYSGMQEIETQDDFLIDNFYKQGFVSTNLIENDFYKNQYISLKSGSKSLLGINNDGRIIPLINKIDSAAKIKARNKEQLFAIDLLSREEIKLVSMTGIAGSGKTFLTLLAGLAGIQDKKYERIIITRSLQTVGKDIGFLPGDINEKMSPWLSPILDNFRHVFKDLSYFEIMRQKGQIEITPLAFIRGRTFNNTFLIVDEAQNSTIHELKTVITRVGENSKVVLLGDTDQIDTPYLDSLSNGLTIVVEKFKNHYITGHITLTKGERSQLATLASKII